MIQDSEIINERINKDLDINKKLFKYEVSVIVVIYNSNFEKIKKTIISAINQKDIKKEIIIADDGSKNNYEKEIKFLFEENDFVDFKLIFNKTNKGTVANLLGALDKAEGEYTKTLSPGDFLIDERALREWVDYLKKNNYNWSFSEAKYYSNESQKSIVRAMAHPQVISPYLSGNKKRCRWNYIALKDVALGAATIGDTGIMTRYCNLIADNGVIYAEDNIWRLMMYDGEVGGYYPYETIQYEYGSGVSTLGNGIWKERLTSDWKNTNDIILLKSKKDSFQKKMCKAIKNESTFMVIFIKGRVWHGLRKRVNKRLKIVN